MSERSAGGGVGKKGCWKAAAFSLTVSASPSEVLIDGVIPLSYAPCRSGFYHLESPNAIHNIT